MTKKIMMLLVVLSLILTACTPSVEHQLEKAKEFVSDKDYDEAIEIYEALIEADETQYDAHKGLARAYLKDDEYKDADEALEAFFEVIKDHYEEDEEVDYTDYLEDIKDYAYDIFDEDEEVGDWFDELNPPMIDLMDIPYDVDIDTPIVLEVPKGMDVYYTLDGSNPSRKDEKYKDSIKLTEEGEVSLSVVAINELGIEGQVNYTYFNAFKMPEAPELSLESGTYEGETILYIEDYDFNTMDVYYSTDGSEATNGYYYYEEDGIVLVSGDYEVNVQYYDTEAGVYSKITTENYTINNPYALTDYTLFNVATIGVSDDVYSQVESILYDLYYEEDNIDINVYNESDFEYVIEEFKKGNLDAIYVESYYIEQLADEGLLADVEKIVELSDYDYYNDAQEIGLYEGQYNMMPITINPGTQLYAQEFDVDSTEIKDWDTFINTANAGSLEYPLLYPKDVIGDWLISYYLGFGGTFEMDSNGSYSLNKQSIMDTLDFAKELKNTYGVVQNDIDFTTYLSIIEEGNASFTFTRSWVLDYYDYYDAYEMVGGMPLPNGNTTKSNNVVSGLLVNKSVIGDTNKEAAARLAYKYLSEGDSVNYIASYASSLPAIKNQLDSDVIGLESTIEIMEAAINSNITIRDGDRYWDTQYVFLEEATAYFNGEISLEEAADAIIDQVTNYSQGE